MQANTFKPLPQLKALWQTINIVCFILLFLPIALMFIMQVEPVLSLIFLGFWLLLFACVLIYIPAFYNTLEYTIDNDAVRLKKGVFWRRRTSVPYGKITNVDITQGPVERLFGISQLHVQTAGSSGAQNVKAELIIYGIRDCEALKDTIMGRIGMRATSAPMAEDTPKDNNLLESILTEVKAIRHKLES